MPTEVRAVRPVRSTDVSRVLVNSTVAKAVLPPKVTLERVDSIDLIHVTPVIPVTLTTDHFAPSVSVPLNVVLPERLTDASAGKLESPE